MRVELRDLGTMEYKACWEYQQGLFEAMLQRKGAAVTDQAGYLLLVEHPAVYTLGKSGREENLLVDEAALRGIGAEFYRIDRGGDITFHGPGQIVGYPILDLERIGIALRDYIGALEEAVIETVAHYGIRAGRIAGASGVWLGGENSFVLKSQPMQEGRQREDGSIRNVCDGRSDELDAASAVSSTQKRKICAIGVRASRHVTMHGFALNVSTDLRYFTHINPCGFADRGVTSIEAETGGKVDVNEVKQLLVSALVKIYNN